MFYSSRHIQQGGAPSPWDRIRATRLASQAFTWLERKALEARSSNSQLSISPEQPVRTKDGLNALRSALSLSTSELLASSNNENDEDDAGDGAGTAVFYPNKRDGFVAENSTILSNISNASVDSSVVIGVRGTSIVTTTTAELMAYDTDFKRRCAKTQWWLNLKDLVRLLAKHSPEDATNSSQGKKYLEEKK